MLRLSPLGAMLSALAFAAASPAQVPLDKSLATMEVADGLQVELFAGEPMFTNPTSIDIDHKGRVWVCEAVNYRRRLRNQPPLRPEGDRIVVLEDTTGDGKADKSHTFYQSPELEAPLGVAVAPDADGKGLTVYVCQSPQIWVFRDADGDLKADGPPEVLLKGFRGIDHDHGVHGILIGPDGKLYFTVGDSGVDGLQSSDGTGRIWKSNDTDCRAGTVWRCDMNGTNLELLAHNFRNNYEPAVDSFGTIWLSDNDDDGTQQTRICYVMPGGNYGYHPRGQGESHWHEERPGVVHKVLRTYFGSPTGMCFYEGELLPEKYRGQILHTDAGPRHLRCYHVTPKGAGYELEQEVMLTSSDNWYRPSDVCVAPDGSVFVSDWYDPGVGGHGMRAPEYGRIWRVTPKGHRGYRVPAPEGRPVQVALEMLNSPCLATRHVGFQTLSRVTEEGGSELVDLLTKFDEKAEWDDAERRELARLKWLLVEPVRHVLTTSKDAQAALGALVLQTGLNQPYEEQSDGRPAWESSWAQTVRLYEQLFTPPLKKHAAEFSMMVWKNQNGPVASAPASLRREWALTLRNYPVEEAKPIFYELAKLYDGEDHFYRAALNIAAGADPEHRKAILADFDEHFPEWDDKVADLVWELRPPSVLPRLKDLLSDEKLTVEQRARIVDLLAVGESDDAGRTVLDIVTAEGTPEPVREKALENLRQFLPNRWQRLRGDPAMGEAITRLLRADALLDSGLALAALAGQGSSAEQVASVATDAKRPLATRRKAVAALGQIRAPESVAAVAALVARPNPLAEDAVRALGGHLPLRGEGPTSKAALAKLGEVATGPTADADMRRAAAEALANSYEGAKWLLEARRGKRLPESVVADAGRFMRNTPFQDIRNEAGMLFPAPGKLDPAKLPSIADLAKRKGNAEQGRKLMLASLKSEAQCMNCHQVRGTGGQIGPDLSMIGKKGSRENLFESILLPSKAIADQYVQYQIETEQGQLLAGLIIAESDDGVTLRSANGKDTFIPTDDILEKTKMQTSIMPENLVATLSEEELIDIVEFLTTLRSPALTFESWAILGPFDNGVNDAGLDRPFGPEVDGRIDPAAKYPGKSGGPVGWRTVLADAQGYVDLQAFHSPASDNVVSYVYREFESPADQEAELLIGSDDGHKLWVNGEQVSESRAHRAAEPGQDTAKVRLKKGRNLVMMKIVNGDGPHGFYLTVLTPEELKPLPLP